MSRNITFAPNEFYHLYNRGTDKRNIFPTKASYQRFLTLLYLCNGTVPVDIKSQGRTLYEIDGTEKGEKLIDLAVYCLMPNHFHILAREIKGGGISKFMQKLQTAYTMYFNKRHDRSGVLFQGKFKAKHSRDDNYLKYLIAYIHLNPVKIIEPKWEESGIKNREAVEKFLNQYPYSSYLDYTGKDRIEKKIIEKNALPEYFADFKDHERAVKEWLSYKPD